MDNTLHLSDLSFLVDWIIIPLIVWIWKTDRRTLIVETKIKDLESFMSTINEQSKSIVSKLDEIKDEIHNSFVSQRSCDFRHK